ncbi:MAG: hypothetical protein JXJ04_12285 [Spirochaetales bacterium]|nr:hypothetical protein [Spirochaetales bacterium]
MNILKVLLCVILPVSFFLGCVPEDDIFPSEPTPGPQTINVMDYQGIETDGAYDMKYFTIGEDHFLIVANHYLDSSYSNYSKIYKWIGYTFTLYQKILTHGALDWEYFTIEGSHYLAVANYYNGASYDIASPIYRWNFETMLFEPYQEDIITHHAYDWEFFTIGDFNFLVCANYYASGSYTTNSVIYRWNGSGFEWYQNIQTQGAMDWCHFTIEEDHYLVVANAYDGSSHNVASYIYRWDSGSEAFVIFDNIMTNGAIDWEFFTINDESYLTVANRYSDLSYIKNSRIYKWDPADPGFKLLQPIETYGAYDWEYFSINNDHYLVLANIYDGDTHNINSAIYKWEEETDQFTKVLSIPTHGATDWEYFTLGMDSFLAAANYNNDTAYDIVSMIYKVLL